MLMKTVFYKLLLHRLHALGRFHKEGKLRLMIALFWCNASWMENMRPLLIGKSVHSQGFRTVSLLPCDYQAHMHAQRMKDLFNEWLRKVDNRVKGTKSYPLAVSCSAHSTLLCMCWVFPIKLHNYSVAILLGYNFCSKAHCQKKSF